MHFREFGFLVQRSGRGLSSCRVWLQFKCCLPPNGCWSLAHSGTSSFSYAPLFCVHLALHSRDSLTRARIETLKVLGSKVLGSQKYWGHTKVLGSTKVLHKSIGKYWGQVFYYRMVVRPPTLQPLTPIHFVYTMFQWSLHGRRRNGRQILRRMGLISLMPLAFLKV